MGIGSGSGLGIALDSGSCSGLLRLILTLTLTLTLTPKPHLEMLRPIHHTALAVSLDVPRECSQVLELGVGHGWIINRCT